MERQVQTAGTESRCPDLSAEESSMIRDRLKKAARKAAIRLLNMEFDTEDRDPNARGNPDASKFDPDKIPPLVDGDGDTPGPNHKQDIGRTWVAAQLAGGVAPIFIDLRPPQECVAGILPGSLALPGELVFENLELLPDKATRVTVYDQTGALGSAEIAERLRDAGWTMARRLRGGFAEWIEHDETIELPEAPTGARFRLGDSVRIPDGRQAWILRIDAGPAYTAWLSDGSTSGPHPEEDLEA